MNRIAGPLVAVTLLVGCREPPEQAPAPGSSAAAGGCLGCDFPLAGGGEGLIRDRGARPEGGRPDGGPGEAMGEEWPETSLRILLSHTAMHTRFGLQHSWTSQVELQPLNPGDRPGAQMVSGCRLSTGLGTRLLGATLDAGEITLSGGLAKPLRYVINPLSLTYEIPEDEDDDESGPPELFIEGMTISIANTGGKDITRIVPEAAWRGVRLLSYRSPQTMASLPSGPITLTWEAAPGSGRMKVAILGEGMAAECPLKGDPGSFTIPEEITREVPQGYVIILVSRSSAVNARTEPDRGAIRLEARSSFRIFTTR